MLKFFEANSAIGWRFMLSAYELLNIFVCKRSKVNNSQKLLGATVQNLVPRATRRPGICVIVAVMHLSKEHLNISLFI